MSKFVKKLMVLGPQVVKGLLKVICSFWFVICYIEWLNCLSSFVGLQKWL